MDRSLLRPKGLARVADFLQLMRLDRPDRHVAIDVAHSLGIMDSSGGCAGAECAADFCCRRLCDARRGLRG